MGFGQAQITKEMRTVEPKSRTGGPLHIFLNIKCVWLKITKISHIPVTPGTPKRVSNISLNINGTTSHLHSIHIVFFIENDHNCMISGHLDNPDHIIIGLGHDGKWDIGSSWFMHSTGLVAEWMLIHSRVVVTAVAIIAPLRVGFRSFIVFHLAQ